MSFPPISFPRGSSQRRDRTQVSHITGRHFTIWATREAQCVCVCVCVCVYIMISHNSVSYNHLWHNCYHGRVTKISEQQIWKGWEFPQLIQEPLLSMADKQCQKSKIHYFIPRSISLQNICSISSLVTFKHLKSYPIILNLFFFF